MATLSELLNDKTKYPDETKVTLADGIETTIGEVRKGYMMEADYRKKTSAVAEEKRQLIQQRQDFEAARLDAEQKLEAMTMKLLKAKPDQSQDDLEAELAANPVARALAEQVKALGTQVEQLKQATGNINQELVQSRQQAMVDQHRQVLSVIKKHDPEADETEIVNYARNNYVPRLDLAYRLLTEEKRMSKAIADAKAAALKEGIEKGKREAIAPTLPQRTRFLAPTLPKDAPTSFDEAADRALQDPEILGLLTSQES